MHKNIVKVMTGLIVVVAFGLAGCGGGGADNAPNNKITAAEAGPAQNVVAGNVITLNGSQSTGADGNLITYQWSMSSKPAGSVATIANASTVSPTFTADLPGIYSITLIVTDSKSITSEDTITVTVSASTANAAPVANAGADQSVITNAVVTLDGSASSDANGDLLIYSWSFTSKPTGSGATLSSASVAKPTFTADVAGAYVLNLVVNDGKVSSAAVTVLITASVANAAPVANAGTDQSVLTSAVVTLDGSASSDANGDLLSYSWSFTSKPEGSVAALSSAAVVKPTFTADVAGAYVLNLVVNDGKVNSVAATVIITATSANQQKTQLLYGTWVLSYTIISAYTDTFALNNVYASTITPGDYTITGTNQYGSLVIGSYSSKYGDWSIYNGGTIASQFYVFQTDGSNIWNGCYYITPKSTGVMSKCYALTGIKTKTTAKHISELLKASDEVAKTEEAEFDTPPSIETVERYNQLKALLPSD